MPGTTPESSLLSRRRCLELAAVGAVAAPLSLLASPALAAAPRRRALRLAHLTDIHVQPELRAAQGLAACLQHVQSQSEPVDLIITGGDSVMDVFAADAQRSQMLAELWRSVFKQECSLPVRSCIGNHDVRPWPKPGEDAVLGKPWALDLLALDNRYYSFDQSGWRFLILDTVQPSGENYAGGVDDEQLAWLKQQLTKLESEQPVIIVSHIPILTLTSLTFRQPQIAHGAQQLPGYLMALNSTPLHQLLREHANVKLCLSGHTHLRDRCEIDGVTYICGGAVSASWWKGRHQTVDEGYGLVDLYDDGSFDYGYTNFGWQAAT